MPRYLLAAVLLSAGYAITACATAAVDQPASIGELAISLSRGVSDTRPILVVTITNGSASRICIRRELLENSYSEQIGLSLRDSMGRAVRIYETEGFILPSIPGLVRLEPGGTARGQYYLDSRLTRSGSGRHLPRGMSARVSYEYDHCDDSAPLRATSAWQPI